MEWLAVQGVPAIPIHLSGLLGLDGVVFGSEKKWTPEDRCTLLAGRIGVGACSLFLARVSELMHLVMPAVASVHV